MSYAKLNLTEQEIRLMEAFGTIWAKEKLDVNKAEESDTSSVYSYDYVLDTDVVIDLFTVRRRRRRSDRIRMLTGLQNTEKKITKPPNKTVVVQHDSDVEKVLVAQHDSDVDSAFSDCSSAHKAFYDDSDTDATSVESFRLDVSSPRPLVLWHVC